MNQMKSGFLFVKIKFKQMFDLINNPYEKIQNKYGHHKHF